MENLKTLSEIEVAQMANRLIKIHGSTTTLDVKKELREIGFRAYQNEVSELMDNLFWEQMWAFECNGTYRTYYKPSCWTRAIMMLPPFSLN